jgi:CRP/FNR family transcriptional regulator, cyclic AMP receptor protein
MANDVLTQRYSDGDIILKQGAIGDEMYVIESGTVRVFRTIGNSETLLGVLKPGEVFGELALFDYKPRSASARAVGETVVRVVSRDEFSALKCDPVIRELLKALGRRLRAADDAFERLNVNDKVQREEIAKAWVTRDWTV